MWRITDSLEISNSPHTRKNNFPDDSVERYHIEIGAPIDSPVTPIAWPRAAGDLPQPPDTPISEMFAKAVALGAFPDKAGRADR
jgi:hypothetical protein